MTTDSNGNATFIATGLAAAAPGSFISATATDAANDTSQFAQDITSIGTADLGVALSTSSASAVVGGQLVYTITVTNAGPTLARNVTAIFNLSSGETVIGTTTSQGTVTVGSTTVGANLNNIAAGSNATVTITVQEGAAAVPSVTDTVSVGTIDGDPNPNNNTATVTTPVSAVADLAVAFNATPPVVLAGTNLTYTIVVTNNGPSPATGVTLTDTLPANVTFVSATDSLGNTGDSQRQHGHRLDRRPRLRRQGDRDDRHHSHGGHRPLDHRHGLGRRQRERLRTRRTTRRASRRRSRRSPTWRSPSTPRPRRCRSART